jgi:predicted XRE-type DNA-binding protein
MSVETVAELDRVVERHNVGLSTADVVAELDAAFGAVTCGGSAPLSASEIAFLRANAGRHAPDVIDSWDPAAERQRQARAAIVRVAHDASASMSIAEAADLLGVDRSRVSHRLTQGTLWAFTMGRVRRVARWQFTAEGLLLPGLPTIVAAIPDDITPAALDAFMRAPLAELGEMTPLEYLTAGGNPAPVAEFLAALGEW